MGLQFLRDSHPVIEWEWARIGSTALVILSAACSIVSSYGNNTNRALAWLAVSLLAEIANEARLIRKGIES